MHEWTQGAIWQNLIFLIRQKFSRESIEERAIDNESFWTTYQQTDSAKEALANAAKQRNWTITENGTWRYLEKVSVYFSRKILGLTIRIVFFSISISR